MKNNDKVIQEKMRSLDTLSSGIVYGKEDAWGKLQARMDRKPARNIRTQYWVAAAVLLVLVIVIPIYYFGEKEVVKNNIAETKTNPSASYAVTAKKQDIITSPIGEVSAHVILPAAKKGTHIAIAPKIIGQSIAKEAKERIQQTQIAASGNVVMVHNVTAAVDRQEEPAPAVVITKKPVAVVSIYDLNGPVKMQKQTTGNIVASKTKWKVASIYDIMQKEPVLPDNLNEANLRLVHVSVTNPLVHYCNATNLNTHTNFFKQVINTQN